MPPPPPLDQSMRNGGSKSEVVWRCQQARAYRGKGRAREGGRDGESKRRPASSRSIEEEVKSGDLTLLSIFDGRLKGRRRGVDATSLAPLALDFEMGSKTSNEEAAASANAKKNQTPPTPPKYSTFSVLTRRSLRGAVAFMRRKKSSRESWHLK